VAVSARGLSGETALGKRRGVAVVAVVNVTADAVRRSRVTFAPLSVVNVTRDLL
jgi:hypothetical protein